MINEHMKVGENAYKCKCGECGLNFTSPHKGDNICDECYREVILRNQKEELLLGNTITCGDCFKPFTPEKDTDVICSNCFDLELRKEAKINMEIQRNEVTDLFIRELSQSFIDGEDEIEIQFGGQGFKFELDLDLALDLQRLFNDRRKK